jgi:hypothetical protein
VWLIECDVLRGNRFILGYLQSGMSSFQSLSQELIGGIAGAVRDASPRLVVVVLFLAVAAVLV